MSNLRPVEALYLLDFAKKELMNEENSLVAILVYLKAKGYVEAENKDVVLTLKGRCPNANLRSYETDILDCFAKDDLGGLLEVINEYDFRESMTIKGFFKIRQRKKGWWKFKWKCTDYLPTDKFYQIIKELEDLKQEMGSAIEKGEPRDKDFITRVCAFPSLTSKLI